ncbi:MAG: hypothetical protein LBV68_05730 [Spirochaetaceae bacterium]|nr:hypothetical protein [Spirochaetaceae bacterium]
MAESAASHFPEGFSVRFPRYTLSWGICYALKDIRSEKAGANLLKIYLFSLFLLLSGTGLFAGEPGARMPYQIPQTIYIGDKGRLIYPLDGLFFDQKDSFLPVDKLSKSDDIVINAIEIKDRQLIVDFQVFKTGIVKVPPIFVNGKTLSGLEVYVASLLENSPHAMVLSPAASPLSVPGTLWIISALVFGIIILAAFILLFFTRGGNIFFGLKLKIKQKRIIRQTQKTIKKLKANLEKDSISAQLALSGISNELRIFLDNFFNIDCRSMVPLEFLAITLPKDSGLDENYYPRYFSEFFQKCDTIRFSGNLVPRETVLTIIEEVETFINARRAA